MPSAMSGAPHRCEHVSNPLSLAGLISHVCLMLLAVVCAEPSLPGFLHAALQMVCKNYKSDIN